MALSIKLKIILVIFCISFGNVTYWPLAKWVFSSDNLENGKIKDLSTYHNEGFSYAYLDNAWTLTCSSVYCDVFPYRALITSVDNTFTEYGVSAWIYFPSNPDYSEFLSLNFPYWSAPTYGGGTTPEHNLEFYTQNANYEGQVVFSIPIVAGALYCRQMNIFGILF